MTIAFVYRSGEIGFNERLPDGAIPITNSKYSNKLKKAVEANARHSYDGKTLLVPGVPEAKSESDALLSVDYFRDIIEMRMANKKGFPPISDKLNAARERAINGKI